MNSNTKPEISEALEKALETGADVDIENFEIAVKEQEFPDAFSVVLSPTTGAVLAAQLGTSDIIEWITRPRTWDTSSYNPEIILTPGEKILHLLWQDLADRVTRKLQVLSQGFTIAPKGAVLCFFAGAELSIVVRYERSPAGAFALQPITVVERPQGVFELSDILNNASPEQRNSIKAAALSVDKLVFQRGVLVHVDRQREDVFGPSIDTVLLAELLAQWLETIPQNAKIAGMEVGCGNGLLSTILASTEKVERLYAIDLNPAAVPCTLKNLQINGIGLEARLPEVSVRGERFRPKELAKKVDLVVCNPPYVPEAASEGTIGSGYHLAISGIALYRELLESLDTLLLPNGRLLLMTSSLSIEEVTKLIPAKFESRPVYSDKGFRVPLDLDVLSLLSKISFGELDRR